MECGSIYQESMPGPELVFTESCGHSPEVEKPDEFMKKALEFLA